MSGVLLAAGLLMAALLIVPGIQLRWYERHHWIAGYNTASPEEKRAYDIEGLSHHLGNGLMTLGVVLIPATIAALLDSLGWCLAFLGVFVFVAMITVVGGRRFLPKKTRPPGTPEFAFQRFLQRLLPETAFRAIEEGTRQWILECPCGLERDFWDAGGVRYKAVGEPRMYAVCERCAKGRWHKIRRREARRAA